MSAKMSPGRNLQAKQIIYDFGSNNGDDIPYYLKKADIVVAVEANPTQADLIRARFAAEISDRRLIIENCVLAAESTSKAAFYVHTSKPFLSQFPKPDDALLNDYQKIWLPARKASDIIRKYGDPLYVKIDIENYDQFVLEEMFSRNIRPPYISAESHSIDVFALLVAVGKYQSFKLVEGNTLSARYGNHVVKTKTGDERYSFTNEMAGPFGDDISGPWISRNEFFRLLAFQGLGWKDVHATNLTQPDAAFVATIKVNFFCDY